MRKDLPHDGGQMVKPPSALDLLGEIRNLIAADRATDRPADEMEPRDWQITAAAGELLIDLDVQAGYFHIPNCPRDVTIYAGSHGAIIGAFKQGAFIQFRIPRLTTITIAYAAGAAATYLSTIIAARPLDIKAGEVLANVSGAAGNLTPSDAQTNPSGLAGSEAFNMGWDGTVWRRVRVTSTLNPGAMNVSNGPGGTDGVPTSALALDLIGTPRPLGALPFGWNGATADRLRTPAIFKTAVATASGSTALWTPTAGKKFRVMGMIVEVTQNSALAAAAVLTIDFLDSATNMSISHSVFLPNAAGTTFGSGFSTGWLDLGNGILSSTINNVLNISLSAALTAGTVRVTVAGTEE